MRKNNRFTGKVDGLLNFSDFHHLKFRVAYWIMFSVLMLMAIICFLPVIWVALSGFKETSEMYSIPPSFLPKSINFGKIKEIWDTVHFEKYFFNSVAIIIGCLIFDIVFNGLAGYFLSKVRSKGSSLLETAIFWTMLLPGVSMAPLYMTFVDFPFIHVNMTGSYLPIWLLAACNAFNIFLFRNFFNGIPKGYFEAARIDGCGNLGIFFRIVLPMSKPILAVICIMSITSSWSNFMWPYLILGNTNLEPVSVMIYQMQSGMGGLQDNQLMLLMTLCMLPPLIVYAFFSKHITGGFNMSGIKG